MRLRLPFLAGLAVLLAGGSLSAQQPTPARDTLARRDTVKTPADSARRPTGPAAPRAVPENPCLDPVYVQLRRIPIERMSDNERRAFEELDGACAEVRVGEARRRMRAVEMGKPDYEHEVVPWLIGVVVFCTAVIMFAQTTR